jgi:DNA transposition AAA+ family ATPase
MAATATLESEVRSRRSEVGNNSAGPGLGVNAGRDRGGPLSTSANIKFKIPGDRVNKATEDLPDEQRSLIRWVHAYYEEHAFELDELAAKLKKPDGSAYSRDSLYQLLTGRREAGVDNMVAAIKEFKREVERAAKLAAERVTITRIGFVVTSLAQKIWKLCNAALIYQKIVFIWGDSQIGKTVALLKYALDHNHGETIYVRVPEGGALYAFMEELAIALRISPQQKIGELRRRIIGAFDDRMLLVIDEIHNCFMTGDGLAHLRVGEFIREIHDRKKCGVIICGTNVGQRAIFTGKHKELTKQLRRRALGEGLQLPNVSSTRDLATIAAAYGLPTAADEALKLQREVNTVNGLGVWMTYLQAASRGAKKGNEKLTWRHVLKTHASFVALGEMKLEEAA